VVSADGRDRTRWMTDRSSGPQAKAIQALSA